MLGLGLGLDRGGYVKAPLPSKVLYERDGNFTGFDPVFFGTTNCAVAFSVDTFAGSSNFLKVTIDSTGSDGIFYLDKSALDGDLDDYYAARAEGGSFKITLEYGFPDANTDTGTVSRARVIIGTSAYALGGPAKDTLTTLTRIRAVSLLADPSSDADYLKFEFEDVTPNEPVSGDVMYVKRLRVEYIAA